ncbi:hypothetical protein M9H77_32122 [Catharanthus roseus]|uniref:Uncharacterized protein n=1 Tax=Catharanthus roseus TaxID=4058 RepID=A0ACC0A3V4_CATRO|nr:hypothetical protein M9H77_32122 [Catharanthus roseus]
MFAAGEDGRGLRTVGTVCLTASTNYQELKANAERLHIEIGSPIPTDEQLMFQLHVFGFFGIFCNMPRGLYREGEEVVGIHAAGTGEVHRLHNIIRILVCSACDSVPTLFPSFSPSDDDATSQPPTGPSYSSPPLPPPSPPPTST